MDLHHKEGAKALGKRVMENRDVCNVLTAALLKHDKAMAGFTNVNRNLATCEFIPDKMIKEALECAFVFKAGVLNDCAPVNLRALFMRATQWQHATAYGMRVGLISTFLRMCIAVIILHPDYEEPYMYAKDCADMEVFVFEDGIGRYFFSGQVTENGVQLFTGIKHRQSSASALLPNHMKIDKKQCLPTRDSTGKWKPP